MALQLQLLADEANQLGWATAEASLDEVRSQAAEVGWTEVPIRSGEPAVATLRPKSAAEAPLNSLSAKYGRGAQPLHTDGAHLKMPPHIVVLYAPTSNATPTLLWSPHESPSGPVPPSAHDGVFVVDGGRDRFYATAFTTESGLRYDPGCMTPADARSREAAAYFRQVVEVAHQHSWSMDGMLLLIDNRQALHARAAVAQGDGNRQIQRVAYRIGNQR